MSDNQVIDPPDPPEASEGDFLKAKDLKNLPIILRPVEYKEVDGNDGKPWRFVECDVWVLGAGGVEQEATGLRVGWWRAVEQIRHAIGRYVPCRPTEQDDRSVILVPLKDKARKIAEQVVADIGSTAAIEDEASSEPF